MCGIAGIWNYNDKVHLEDIQVFTDSMTHRGPDGGGYKVFEDVNLALGHRRLSVLDLSEAGSQPMEYGGGNYWITYNGEVYNFLEVREELERDGFVFRSTSDTEVILASFIKWGYNCPNKFNGMFAFAIYHKAKNELFIARDRFGVKPLFYTFIPGKLFAFASETIAFKSLKGFKRELNEVNFKFSIQSPGLLASSNQSIFNNISQLKAGCFLIVNQNSERTFRWYELSENIKPVNESYEQQVEHFRELFLESCKLRLRSDVTIASALSGGVDSSSVFCTIQHLAKTQIKTKRFPSDWQRGFSMTFPGSYNDESKYVKIIRDKLGADVELIEVNRANLVQDIIKGTRLYDDILSTPINSVSDVYKAMRGKGITVSLDGHGVDELMFGYRSAVYEVLFDAHLCDKNTKDQLAELYLLMTAEHASAEKIAELNQRVAKIAEKFKPTLKKQLTNKIKSLFAAQTDQYRLPSNIEGHANRFLYRQFVATELPHNFRDFDRAAMQNSIEIRMPFMDYRIVEYCWSLPMNSKIGNGFTKRILRDSMRGIVPDEILDRKTKIGLNAPTADWLNGDLSGFVKDLVSTKKFKESMYWDGEHLAQEYIRITNSRGWTNESAAKAWCVINAHLISE